MFRQRERFERTDVPRESPYRNVIGVVVCVAVFVAVAMIVSQVWNRVRLESRLGDSDLSGAISTQALKTVAEPSGFVAAEGEFENVLLLTASSLDETGATLSSVRALVINRTQGTMTLVNVPVSTKVVSGDVASPLSDLYASSGYAACVAPISAATGMGFSHVIVTTGDMLEETASVTGSGVSDLVRSASGLLEKIRTDMDAAELLSLAEALSSVGVSNIVVIDSVYSPETTLDEAGNSVETGLQLVDSIQTCMAAGLLVAAA